MNELALFAGAGGGILGGHLLGWRTVCAVEIDNYARHVLLARQDAGSLEPFPIWDDVTTFDGREWQGCVDVVSGGFPCQDISAAGQGEGITGERSGLWKHMARIIGEVGPRFVLVENSPALTSRGLGVVLGDLASLGYDAVWGVLGAVHAGAPHKRERIWILAYSKSAGSGGTGSGDASRQSGVRGGRESATPVADSECLRGGKSASHLETEGKPLRAPQWEESASRSRSGGEALADADCVRKLQPQGSEQNQRGWTSNSCDVSHAQRNGRGEVVKANAGATRSKRPTGQTVPPTQRWWESEPDVGRVANGVAARVDRLRCLGNGQVPAVVRLAWETLTTLSHNAQAD